MEVPLQSNSQFLDLSVQLRVACFQSHNRGTTVLNVSKRKGLDFEITVLPPKNLHIGNKNFVYCSEVGPSLVMDNKAESEKFVYSGTFEQGTLWGQ